MPNPHLCRPSKQLLLLLRTHPYTPWPLGLLFLLLQEFFASLPEEVASHLQALPCIPTEADDGGVGPWVAPGNALLCSSPTLKQLVPAEQLARLQGKYFVHPSLSALYEPHSQLRKLLRIREFDPQEVILLVRVSAGEQVGGRPGQPGKVSGEGQGSAAC